MYTPKIILVTGGHGFVGTHLCKALKEKWPEAELRIPSYPADDLRDMSVCKRMVQGVDTVIHLAATVGGIGFNGHHPGKLFYDNIMMCTQLLHASMEAGVRKFVGLGTICAYPKFTPVPFKEDDIWNGYPEETNGPYGLAKKMMLVQSIAYRQEYGFNAIYLLPVNMYGPGDNFNPESSHVIPAIIRKMIEARDAHAPNVDIWGTGKATREFVFVRDVCRGIILATEKYDGPLPINIGSGIEISIKDLVEKIKIKCGYTGEIVWDTSKPDGQPRRQLDITRARELLGYEPQISFDAGLDEVITWYEKSS